MKVDKIAAVLACLVLSPSLESTRGGEIPTAKKRALLPLTTPGGWVMTPDNVTLIVSLGRKRQLAFFDTLLNKELKRVKVSFRPGALALQGKTLFAVGQDSRVVYLLDAATGKLKNECLLSEGPVHHLACHPTSGHVYASTFFYSVYAIDPKSGKAVKTAAKGHFLAVDPLKGKFVYAGIQPSPRDGFIVERSATGKTPAHFDTWGRRAILMKYRVKGAQLEYLCSQENAALNGYHMHLSPDGERIMMVGARGWQPYGDAKGGGYITPIYSTKDLRTKLGKIVSKLNIAFHPVLNIAVINDHGYRLMFFDSKTFEYMRSRGVRMGRKRWSNPVLLTFGGKGTRVIAWNGNDLSQGHGLHFVPLPLSADDRAALQRAYGKKSAK